MTSRGRSVVTMAAVAGGVALFAYAIRDVGWTDVAAGIRRVGWGLVPILALAGLRFVLRAEAWRRCMPPDVRIPFLRALTAYLSGDAIGNVTPLGLIASEPTKVFLTRHHLATREAVSSLALDVFIYATSAVAMIAIGLVALLGTLSLPAGWREGILLALVMLGAGVAIAWRMVGGTWDEGRGPRPRWRAKLASLRESVRASAAVSRADLTRVFVLHLLFHAGAFVEGYLTLRWLLDTVSPTLTEALIFSALDRAIIVLFKFVPFRIGVDEASSSVMAALLGWPSATGVAFAIIKKVRSLAWTGVGLLLIASHPARAPREADPRETERVHRT